MHKWHFSEYEDPKISFYELSIHSFFVICMLLPASLPFLFQLCLKVIFIECRVPERQGTDSSASFILFSISSSPYVESVSTLPCLGLTVVSVGFSASHYPAVAVAAFTRLLRGHTLPFWLGHTGAKQFHVLQLSCFECKWCCIGRATLCMAAEV